METDGESEEMLACVTFFHGQDFGCVYWYEMCVRGILMCSIFNSEPMSTCGEFMVST